MNIERTMPILGLITCLTLASCSGDEKSPTPTSKDIRNDAASTAPAPSLSDASAATRQAAAEPPRLDPPAAAPDPSPSEPNPADASPADPGSAMPDAADAEAPLLSPEDAAIPTQEEADLEASQSINDDNADQELDKLEKELGADEGG